MARITLAFGSFFIILGLIGFFGSGTSSVTALIPAFFGILFVVLGLAGQDPARRRTAMHVAAALAVVGLAGSAMGLSDFPALLRGDDLDRPWAVGTQSIMALLLLVYIVLAVRSFIAARQDRTAA